MRLVLVGTGYFGVPAFERLYESGHEVVAVVTAPLPSEHKSRKQLPPSPVRQLAQRRGTPILDPQNINDPKTVEQLRELQADLLVVCDYGQILSAEVLATARLGGVNLHASLLPKYRGAAPVVWAILNGEQETGVSVIHMTPQVDAGPIIAQAKLAIDPDETAGELEQRLADLGAEVLPAAIEQVAHGTARPIPQDPALASKAPRLKKSDGLIDWDQPAQRIKNHVRAMQPWPKAFTFWHGPNRGPIRLIITKVVALPEHKHDNKPGVVTAAEKSELAIACKDGCVRIEEIQPAGKRLMTAEEFLRGYPVKVGDRFGRAEAR